MQNKARQNLTKYWRQFYPDWSIPVGYHVHHIRPQCTFKDKTDPRIHSARNLIALHPDDHQTIHLCRGDTQVANGFLSVKGRKCSPKTIELIRANSIKQSRDPDYIKKMRVLYDSMEYQQTHNEACNKSRQTQSYKNKRTEMYESESWKSSCTKANIKKNARTIVTPLGMFRPSHLALTAHNQQVFYSGWLKERCRKDPTNFYFIDCIDKGD